MALSRFEKDMQIIQALDDEPNDVGGLTSADLKAAFDEGGEALKAFLNGVLIPALDTYIARTDNPHAVTKVQVGLGNCDNTADADKPVSAAQLAAIAGVVLGQIPDASLTMAKMAADVTAELAGKADWNDGNITTGSILNWAESKTVNTCIATDTNVMGFPYTGYWGVNFYYYPAGNWRVLIATDVLASRQYFIVKNESNPWSAWKQIATATPPQEYDLPLASGMSSVGRSVYRKNQFNEVFLSFDVNGNIPYGQLVATLPVGYRPAAAQFIPCFCGVDWTSGFVSIENDGSIKAHFSATQQNAISQTSFVAMN